ncbi:cytochrome b [Gluconacetobacter takamatsuzukensis]|uniref:Cytochrome b n=1 Tax=Gluconacetobacter takamatsuzukensis TaxID=1286190 RepID=A0A7W4PP47_9PROT|nr:cytochrome b [Gluconacetobacter takamatsuzukensis]MBB2205045.1 cytochrome b [Gluconacetobacter takamatsuzukensis]
MRPVEHFPLFARILHWLMAAMILTMLFVGIVMVTTVGPAYHQLVDLHRPLGICILALALVRLVNRLLIRVPPLPDTLPPALRTAARLSHIVLYALMIALPLVGWGMLSAGAYPVAMWPGFALPPILPHDPALFALLRHLHTWLALILFGVVLVHLAAALMHGLLLRDDVLPSMTSGPPADARKKQDA